MRHGTGAEHLERLSAAQMQPLKVANAAPILTIVVPTLNERDNIKPLIALLDTALANVDWEVMFVDDDSTDDTARRIRALALVDPRVRCIQRIGRRGLSTACIEGVLASSAPYVAVMDADLQHDEALLPRMLEILLAENVDVVIGSRYARGGGLGDWAGNRAWISRLGTRLARLVCNQDITDPLSGFFMCRRDVFEGVVRRLSGQGFKILLDLLASSSRPLRVRELPFEFRSRRHGESKLDTLVVWEYFALLADKLFGRIVPIRFALFASIGAVGLAVHMPVLWGGLHFATLSFGAAQSIATLAAMTSNFFLNNILTYRDQRLRGWRMLRGLLTFYAICAIGATANVGIASYLFNANQTWWVAGVLGVIIGAVWNYAMSSIFTWRAF
ncbi:MAG TPA: glycosyltransferase family 2 protein [Xanthobacteraceae bacterium]|nr:glycosyltransferase family 2 protein [Xanthobacteraceae bacterium]